MGNVAGEYAEPQPQLGRRRLLVQHNDLLLVRHVVVVGLGWGGAGWGGVRGEFIGLLLVVGAVVRASSTHRPRLVHARRVRNVGPGHLRKWGTGHLRNLGVGGHLVEEPILCHELVDCVIGGRRRIRQLVYRWMDDLLAGDLDLAIVCHARRVLVRLVAAPPAGFVPILLIADLMPALPLAEIRYKS